MKKELVLELHGWRKMRPDDDHELVVLFCFTLKPANWRQAGASLSHEDVFWTEVKLPRFLAEQPGWKKLSRDEKIKAMFQHAADQIQAARRKLREAALIWTPTSRLRNGPPWNLDAISFPKAPPIRFEAEESPDSPRFRARQAAGLNK